MMPTRRQILTGSLSMVALASVLGCTEVAAPGDTTSAAPERSAAAPTALTIGLTYIPNVQFSPFYVARDQGLFSEQGLDVTLRHHGAQEDPFGALLAGQEDLLFASGDEAVVAAATGANVATFGTGFQQFPGVLLTSTDSGITSVDDLRGRTIGLPGHFGSSYYTVLAALHLAGLDADDVTLQDIGYTQVTALMTGRVDVVVGYSNNESVQFAAAGFDVVELAVQESDEPTLVGPGLITVLDRFDDDVLRRVKAAMLEAEKRILADPGVGIEATRNEVPTLSEPDQEKTARAVLAATSKLWLRSGEPSVDVDQEAFVRMGEFLTEAGVIEGPPKEPTVAV